MTRALRLARYRVAQGGPYRVISCANDTYRVERVPVHCAEHEKPPKEYCEGCAMAGQGLFSRLSLAAAMELALNALRPRGAEKLCKGCGQPMLRKGRRRRHPEDYRHAQGCPEDRDARRKRARGRA